MNLKPRKYQKRCVRKADKFFNGRVLIADDPGLGKTVEALLWLHKHPEARPAIVVCEATIKEQWRREALNHVGIRATVLDGRKPSRLGPLTPKNLIIINYDILSGWVNTLKRLRPKCIIIDETQRIKNQRALRTKATRKLCRGVRYILGLSGTPIENCPAEFFPILNIINPRKFNSFFSFGHRYCDAQRKPWGWEYKGSSNEKELNRLVRRELMIRRRKKDVMKELPSKTRVVVPLQLRNRKEYDEALNDFRNWLKKKSPLKAKRAASAEKLVKIGYLKRLAAEMKLKLAIKWIEEFLEDSDKKLIVFAIHKKVIAKLRKHFRNSCVVVDGSTSRKQRQKNIDRFNHRKKVRLFIGQIKAAGTGWSGLTSYVAFIELGWTPGEVIQCEDRIHGMGRGIKGTRATIYYLVAEGTIEETLCKILQKKQRILEEVLDGNVGRDKLDVFDLLVQELAKRGNNENLEKTRSV